MRVLLEVDSLAHATPATGLAGRYGSATTMSPRDVSRPPLGMLAKEDLWATD
jgi:hypothetical protein